MPNPNPNRRIGMLSDICFDRVDAAPNAIDHQGGKLLPLYIKTTLGLFVIAFFPSVVLFIWSPQIFAWVFGSQWYAAGEFARWLVLWLIVGFCNLPSALFGRILRQQKKLFFYELVSLAAATAALVGGGYFMKPINTVILYSVVGGSMNAFLIFWIYTLLKSDVSRPGNEDWETEPKASDF